MGPLTAGCPLIGGALLAFAWFVPAWLPAADCTPVPLDVAAIAEHHPPAVRSDYGPDELRSLAGRSASAARHPPLGFYAATFGYTVHVTADGTGTPGCGPAVRVVVRMLLADRLIEVAGGPQCRFEAVVSHYLAQRIRTTGCSASTRAGRAPCSG